MRASVSAVAWAPGKITPFSPSWIILVHRLPQRLHPPSPSSWGRENHHRGNTKQWPDGNGGKVSAAALHLQIDPCVTFWKGMKKQCPLLLCLHRGADLVSWTAALVLAKNQTISAAILSFLRTELPSQLPWRGCIPLGVWIPGLWLIQM